MKTAYLNQLSDEDLMESFQSGYEQAFNVIMARYQERLHNFLFRYTRNHLDCQDLVQETFLRVYRCRNSYERIARFSTWLYTIAGNLAKTQFKKSSRMTMNSLSGYGDDERDEQEIEISDWTYVPDQEVEEQINIEHLMKALDRIPAEFKDVVIMRDVQNLTYEEIEQITGLAMGTVKSRINRGRVRLQKLLKNVYGEETFVN